MIKRSLTTHVAIFLGLAMLTALLYGGTLSAPFAFDDKHNILANPAIRMDKITLPALQKAVRESLLPNRPLANISFAFNYYYGGYQVAGYHLVNILVHLANGFLLFLFLRKILETPALKNKHPQSLLPALAAALIWFCHPLATQSVTYIVQRMNSLATLFYLSGFLFYLYARQARRLAATVFLAAGAFSCALLAFASKQNAVTLPFFILLFEWYFFRDCTLKVSRRNLALLAAALCLGGLILYLQFGIRPWESILAGYGRREFTLQERLLTETRVVLHYVTLLILPLTGRLNFDYEFPLSHSLADPAATFPSLLLLAAMTCFAILGHRRHRLFSFAILWFLGNLVIESSVIGLEIIFEHRTYLPSLLFFLPFVLAGRRLLPGRAAGIVVTALLVAALSGLTHARNLDWQDEISLWTDVVNKSPNKSRARMNLGIALRLDGRLDEAMPYLYEAARLEPQTELAHYTLGEALAEQGKLMEASYAFNRALQINQNNVLARFSLAKTLAAMGKYANALYHYSLAVNRDRFLNHKILYHQGLAFLQAGRTPEAIAVFSQALQEKPGYGDAALALAQARNRLTPGGR